MAVNEGKQALQGCYVATLTPFQKDDTLDTGVAREHAHWLVENGAAGLCPAGTTGEFLFLSEAEKRAIVTAAMEGAGGRVPVLAGVWALQSEAARDLARHAEDSGAQGVFLPPPIYYPASDEAIYQWYAQIHKATSLPVFAYNIPQYAANMISVACLKRMLNDGIIAGVKDSMGKTERMTELVQEFGSHAVVFAASDGFAREGRQIGAHGFISAIANATPRLFAQLWAGEDHLQPQVDELRTTLKQMGSIPALKYLCGRQGFDMGHARLPFSDLTPEHRALLDAISL